jgi:D-threo-aldose 1-dehydrogenase
VAGDAFVTRGGQSLPFTPLGFGGASIGNMHRSQTDAETTPIVDAAWDLGQRYFDTAPLYGLGLSERRLGLALRGRPRDSYLLSTKVGRLLEPGEMDGGIYKDLPPLKFIYDYSYDGVMRSFETSLERIGTDRVDILYVHDIDGRNHPGRTGSEARIRELIDQGGWRALDELRTAGTVKAIGCGVNEWEPCARLLEVADPDLFLIAGRYTLLEQEPLNALFPECAKRGVGVVIGGPLNAGALMGGEWYDYAPITAPIRARVAALQDICRAHDVPILAAALQFTAAHPVVVSVISGAASIEEVQANARAFASVKIPAAFWAALKAERAINLDAPTPC